MPKKLLLTLLTVLPLAACQDHAKGLVVADGPTAPINEPDTQVLPTPGETNPIPSETGNGGAPATSSPGGSSPSTGTSTSGNNNPNGNPQGPGTNGNGQPASNEPGTGGGNAGSPVPEPGTLLLVGTGLAGLAGASMRRRRRKQ